MRHSVIALAAAATFAAACAPAQQSASTGPAPAPAPVGEFKLRVGLTTLGDSMDPHAALGFNPRRYGLYETLVGQDDDGKLVAMLATKWESTTPTEWQLTLAGGRKFHDGKPVTAEDVAWSINRATNPDNRLAILGRVNTIEKAEVTSPTTVNVITRSPDPLLVKRIATLAILQKAHVESLGIAQFATRAMGTGPYKQKEFLPNDRLVLVPNENHPQQPGAAEIAVRHLPEASARLAGLRSGDLDIISNISVDAAEQLKSGNFTIVNFNKGTSIGAFIFTNLQGEPTQDKRVRQALNYAVDKNTIARQIYKGYTQPTGQVMQKDTVGFSSTIRPYAFDVVKARQLLAEAGYANGISIQFDMPLATNEGQALALIIQSQWRAAGINATIGTSADSAWLLDRFYGRTKRPHVFATSLQNSPALDGDYALTWFRGTEPEPARRYNNPLFDEPYLASTSEMGQDKRVELLQKASQAMYDDPPWLFLVDGFTLWAAAPNLVNVNPRGDLEPLWQGIRRK